MACLYLAAFSLGLWSFFKMLYSNFNTIDSAPPVSDTVGDNKHACQQLQPGN